MCTYALQCGSPYNIMFVGWKLIIIVWEPPHYYNKERRDGLGSLIVFIKWFLHSYVDAFHDNRP